MELFKFKYQEIVSIRTLLYVIPIFLSFVLILVKTLGRNPILVKFASSLKGPTPIPIFGNSLQYLVAGKEAATKLMPYWRKKYGPIYKLWFGNELYVVISDVDFMKDIFSNSKVLFTSPGVIGLWNFLTDNDAPVIDLWKVTRSLQSHFSPCTVKKLIPKMNQRIAQLTDDLQRKTGREFDVCHIIHDTLFDMFTLTEFDYVMDTQTKLQFDFDSMSNKILTAVVGLSMFFPGMRGKFAQYLINNIFVTPLRKSYHKYVKMMTNRGYPSIQNDMEKSTEQHKSSFLWTVYQRKNLALNSNNIRTNENKLEIDPSGVILFAAVGGTSMTLRFTLLMIAMHRSVQDKLYEEIHEVFGDDQRQANYEDIERLSYMDQVISETLRLNTYPLIIRHVSEDTRIGPYVFPKGTNVVIDGNGVHLDAKLYPRPLEFNPDNFNEGIAAKRSPYSFLGFSAGARRCMGQTFARTEMKLMLVEILRKFILRTSLRMEDMKFNVTLETHSINGYPISFVSRE